MNILIKLTTICHDFSKFAVVDFDFTLIIAAQNELPLDHATLQRLPFAQLSLSHLSANFLILDSHR